LSLEIKKMEPGTEQKQGEDTSLFNREIANAPVNVNPTLRALEGLLPESELNELSSKQSPKTTEQSQPAGDKAQETKKEANKPEGEAPAAQSGKENVSAEEGNPEEKQGTEKKSLLGLNKTGSKKSEFLIETPDQILEVLKKDFGQEYKGLNETSKFFEVAKKWRADSQKAETLEQENKDLKKLWEEDLPSEFVEAAKLHINGEDYMKAFMGKPKINFSIPLEKQNIETLVNEYFPGKFSAEDFKEEVKSQALEIAITAAQDKFNSQSQQLEAQRASVVKSANEKIQMQTLAVASSVDALSKSFPEADKDAISDVRKILEGGVNKIVASFFDEKGLLRPEAAKMMFLAKHGESEIEILTEIAARKAESKANEDIVSRGADGKKPVQRTGSTTQLSKETEKKIQELEKATTIQKRTF